MTTTYYVEPGYWQDGYTADIVAVFVDASAASDVASVVYSAALLVRDASGASSATSSVDSNISALRTLSGAVNSTTDAAAAARIVKIVGGLVPAFVTTAVAAGARRTTPEIIINAQSLTRAAAGFVASTAALTSSSLTATASARRLWDATEGDAISGAWANAAPSADTPTWTDTDPVTGAWS